jgi:hypothetical protein
MSHSADKSNAGPAGHVVLLLSFTALFALRVAAQLVQYARPTPFLPPFDAWQGSGLDYPVLLASQLVIIALMGWGIGAVQRRARVRKTVGRWLIVLGVLYFGSMFARLVLGLTVLADVAWFAKPLPALFHLVLAGFVLTLGHYHSRAAVVPDVAQRS